MPNTVKNSSRSSISLGPGSHSLRDRLDHWIEKYRLVSDWLNFGGNMTKVGAFEAKTHLPKLLERVQQGERIVITKHGQPIAELIPFRERNTEDIRRAIDRLRAFQKHHDLGGMTIKSLIEEGRTR